MYVMFNEKLTDSQEGFISATSEGFAYGYGLFETLKVVNGNIFFLEEHLDRMIKGCIELNMPFDYDLKRIKKYCEELVLANNFCSGSIKILYSKNKEKCDLIIYTGDKSYAKERYEKGFEVCFAEGKRNPFEKLVHIKTNNYLGNVIEKQNAKGKGWDEAVFLNVYDKICEGTCTNIFFVKNDFIFTPSIQCGILPGIMRDKIIFLIEELNLNLVVDEFSPSDILNADEVFLTNSLMEIMPVSRLEAKNYNLEEYHMTQILKNKFVDSYYQFLRFL